MGRLGCGKKCCWRLLAKEPSPGYQLRARLNDALGSLGEEMNDGQIYVPLGRLERAGLVAVERIGIAAAAGAQGVLTHRGGTEPGWRTG